MVNADRFKHKLSSLLRDDNTSKRKNNNTFMDNRHRLQHFIKRNPDRLNTLANQLVLILEKIDKELSIST